MTRGLESTFRELNYTVRRTDSACDTDGGGVDAACVLSALDAADVRTHPHLHEVPVILVMPDADQEPPIRDTDNIWPVVCPAPEIPDHLEAALRSIVNQGATYELRLRPRRPVRRDSGPDVSPPIGEPPTPMGGGVRLPA